MEGKSSDYDFPVEVRSISSRPAEPPRSISRATQLSERRYSRSVFLGYLLYLQRMKRLPEDKERYLLKLQAKVNLDELQRAIHLMQALISSRRSAARAEQDLQAVLHRTPIVPAKSVLPEQRRIGVGYRDKGSLRPKHKPRPEAGIAFWSEDLPLLEKNTPEEPRWITAEELYGPEMYDTVQELAFLSYLNQTSSYAVEFFSGLH